jgi:hypothetical protein
VKLENIVWVESTAVGKIDASTPHAEMIGNATVKEHLPTQEMSCIVKILFINLLNLQKVRQTLEV